MPDDLRPTRPQGRPVMLQNWGNLLFLHWELPAERLAARLPDGIDLDLHEGRAWVGVVPFTMWGVRPSFFPAVPGLSAFHELNVRTYVRADGVPGVWFFSLDASSPVAVLAARLTYHLPYYTAQIRIEQDGPRVRYRSRRTHRNAATARFDATWSIGAPLPEARPGSLEHFLTERYCLYAEHRGRVSRGRIHHEPWPLREAEVQRLDSTMVEAVGLPAPEGTPLAFHADRMAVEIWPLHPARTAARAGPSPIAAPGGTF